MLHAHVRTECGKLFCTRVWQVRQQVVAALQDNLDVDGTCTMDYVRLRYIAVKL